MPVSFGLCFEVFIKPQFVLIPFEMYSLRYSTRGIQISKCEETERAVEIYRAIKLANQYFDP